MDMQKWWMDPLPVSDVHHIKVANYSYIASYFKYLYLYRIEPSLGKVESLTADSCKHIREVLATDCSNLPNSGIYWVWKEKPMQVL